jgi:hypothetical protein
MLFNNVDKSKKIEILLATIPKFERDVYQVLIELAIDPATFDEDNFEEIDPLISEDDLSAIASRRRLKQGLDSLQLIKQEIASLEV